MFWNLPSLARSCPPFRVPSLIRPSKPRLSASGRPLGADDKRSKDQPTGNIDKPSILEFTTVFEPQKSGGPFKRKEPTDKIILRCQRTHNQSTERRPAKLYQYLTHGNQQRNYNDSKTRKRQELIGHSWNQQHQHRYRTPRGPNFP